MPLRRIAFLCVFCLGCSTSEDPNVKAVTPVKSASDIEDLIPLRSLDDVIAAAKSAQTITVIDLWAMW